MTFLAYACSVDVVYFKNLAFFFTKAKKKCINAGLKETQKSLQVHKINKHFSRTKIPSNRLDVVYHNIGTTFDPGCGLLIV